MRRILEAVPGGVVHVAKDGSIREANAEALRILGLRFDEVTSRFIADWDPETIGEDGKPFPAADYPVARVLTTGKPQPPVTLGVRKRDGDVSWAVFRAEPVHDAAGELSGAIVTFLDITERKRAEEALRLSEERWRVLAMNLPDYVLVADRAARILSINRVLPDVQRDVVLSSTLYDYLDEGARADYAREFERALAGETVRFETRGQGVAQALVWYETQLVPLAAPSGEISRVLVVSRDVTERRSMLAGLAEKERLASVGMLAASVAHEIMNPLTYVLANLDFVVGERTDDPARRMKALTEAREGARRMQQIVWDLRALGRAGGEELFYVDARTVLEIALRLSGPEVARTASVVLELDEVPCVLASESRLCQVFINLLVNAAQAMEQREVEGREIRVKTRNDEARNLVGIDIADNGAGIAPGRIARIFEPFYTTKEAGTGLGLSICRDIVERMGGRIDVSSTFGAGTTFTVWLSTTREASSSSVSASEAH
ncbi:MAG TPA: PAS domain-containing protein [Labilithrix sp.]|nr:PAS domain-containing protein [Labilithrix sp.]